MFTLTGRFAAYRVEKGRRRSEDKAVSEPRGGRGPSGPGSKPRLKRPKKAGDTKTSRFFLSNIDLTVLHIILG